MARNAVVMLDDGPATRNVTLGNESRMVLTPERQTPYDLTFLGLRRQRMRKCRNW